MLPLCSNPGPSGFSWMLSASLGFIWRTARALSPRRRPGQYRNVNRLLVSDIHCIICLLRRRSELVTQRSSPTNVRAEGIVAWRAQSVCAGGYCLIWSKQGILIYGFAGQCVSHARGLGGNGTSQHVGVNRKKLKRHHLNLLPKCEWTSPLPLRRIPPHGPSISSLNLQSARFFPASRSPLLECGRALGELGPSLLEHAQDKEGALAEDALLVRKNEVKDSWVSFINPFTPKSDQFKISPVAPSEI